jgi:hypothetical protein
MLTSVAYAVARVDVFVFCTQFRSMTIIGKGRYTYCLRIDW